LWFWGPAPLISLLAVYVGGYFALGDSTTSRHSAMRCYRYKAVAYAYAPIGKLESMIFQRTVYLSMPGDWEFGSRMLRFSP
jgi:hypothetical protein